MSSPAQIRRLINRLFIKNSRLLSSMKRLRRCLRRPKPTGDPRPERLHRKLFKSPQGLRNGGHDLKKSSNNRRCIDYFQYFWIKCKQLSMSDHDLSIQLWPTIKSLMILIIDKHQQSNRYRLHYDWNTIKGLRKLSSIKLMIEFKIELQLNHLNNRSTMIIDTNRLIVKFSNRYQLNCFLGICRKIGRMVKKKSTIFRGYYATVGRKSVRMTDQDRKLLRKFLKN